MAQPIQPHAYASGGIWALRLGPEYYVNHYPVLQGYGGIGGGVRLRILKPVDFSPEVGLDCYGLHYNYARLGDPRDLVSSLNMLFVRVSPGLEVRFPFGLQFRAGLPLLLSSGAWGSYQIRTFTSGQGRILIGDYHSGFGRIRAPAILGAEVNLGYRIMNFERWGLTAQMSGYYGFGSPIMKYSANAPHNPFLRRISIGIGILRLPAQPGQK
ncbi:MAG: hypothetical protein U0176_16105 [Bacteroidia bacterium]